VGIFGHRRIGGTDQHCYPDFIGFFFSVILAYHQKKKERGRSTWMGFISSVSVGPFQKSGTTSGLVGV